MDQRQLYLINQDLYELKGYSVEENKEEMIVRCGVLKSLLYYVSESETLSIENISAILLCVFIASCHP